MRDRQDVIIVTQKYNINDLCLLFIHHSLLTLTGQPAGKLSVWLSTMHTCINNHHIHCILKASFNTFSVSLLFIWTLKQFPIAYKICSNTIWKWLLSLDKNILTNLSCVFDIHCFFQVLPASLKVLKGHHQMMSIQMMLED